MANPSEFFHLNNQNSLHPPMQDVVGNSHAETKAEIEARRRAEQEAEMARLASENTSPEAPHKYSLWFAFLTIIFLLVALAGAGFGVWEYFENKEIILKYNDLSKDYKKLESDYYDLRELYHSVINNDDSKPSSSESPVSAQDQPQNDAS